ncbi:MAG: type II secretion system protein [Acutalibacteraceae bacterium]
MFKFMKSKKGFTLVELMIVVVIMAILVAVAVPIFSAVTANAKKKTCIGNQRQIISSVGDWIMVQPEPSKVTGGFKVSGGQEAGAFSAWSGDMSANEAEIRGLFKTIPVCPADGVISVDIEVGNAATGKQSTVRTSCTVDGHVVPNTTT